MIKVLVVFTWAAGLLVGTPAAAAENVCTPSGSLPFEKTTLEDIQRALRPHYAITDDRALARDPKTLKSTGEFIPVGTTVKITAERTVGRRSYVEVTEVLPKGSEGTPRVWWTAESNLGSTKEFDRSMEPATKLDLTGLTGLDRKMAIIYNTKGGYIADRAKALGIKPKDLAAVMTVEASGAGFSSDGRPIIRFENHKFKKYYVGTGKHRDKARLKTYNAHFKSVGKKSWQGHRFRADPKKDKWGSFHGNQGKEHTVLNYAAGLDEDAAYSSISSGIGQVMGFNYSDAGYSSPKAMFDDFSKGIKPQIQGFTTFIENCKTCMNGLKKGDYTAFATGYNGSGQAAHYGGRISSAAAAYQRILDKVEAQKKAAAQTRAAAPQSVPPGGSGERRGGRVMDALRRGLRLPPRR